METNKTESKLKVTLMSWTKDPIKTIYWAFMNMHNKVPDSLDEINLSDEELNSFMEMLMAQPHQTVFEFVKLVWKIEGASRAFQQQLTRTRNASYSIQSLRIVALDKFADQGDYTKSPMIKSKPEAEKLYDETMFMLQERYKKLLEIGCPVEDSRGILPLNIHSTITMAIDMRNLYHMLELRFCQNTQDEYRQVAEQMKQEIAKKIHPVFTKPMTPSCFKNNICTSTFTCGKYPGRQKAVKVDVSRWLKG